MGNERLDHLNTVVAIWAVLMLLTVMYCTKLPPIAPPPEKVWRMVMRADPDGMLQFQRPGGGWHVICNMDTAAVYVVTVAADGTTEFVSIIRQEE